MNGNVILLPNVLNNNVDDTKELIVRDAQLQDLMDESLHIASLCEDYNVTKATSQRFRYSGMDNSVTYISDEEGVSRNRPISRYAMGQLCSKLGVPVRYLDKCLDTGRLDLAEDNVNSWLEDFGKDLFIREYDGRVRGILSSKYSVCDSHEILEVVDDTLDLSQYDIKGSFLNEERLHLRFASKEKLPVEGEDLFAGIMIDSSDVGRSILNCRFIIYKQVCTNGLVLPSKMGGTLFQQKHIGISSEEFREGLIAGLQNVEIISKNAVEFVEYTRSQEYKLNSQDRIDKFIEKIRNETRLSQESSNKVIELMAHRYDNTKWGYINAITEVAQDFSLERRLELERIAGNILIA